MMSHQLKLTLTSEEFNALYRVARMELRVPEDQARFLLRQEMVRRGLLPETRQQIAGQREHANADAK